jgi:hypothetical protein
MSAAMLRDESVSNIYPDPDRISERLRALHAHRSEIEGGAEGRRTRTRTRLVDPTRSAHLHIQGRMNGVRPGRLE